MHIRPLETPTETAAFFRADLDSGTEIWVIVLKATGEVIGNVQLLGGTRVPGMGYLLLREFWGQGLMAEALRALLNNVFRDRQLGRVELWINEQNNASRRVAEKLGFRLKGRIHQRYDWEDNHHIMLTYGLWADEWTGVPTPSRPRPAFFGVQPVLVVSDVDAAVAFYTEKLAFEVDFLIGEPPNHAGLVRGNWSCDQAYLQLTAAPVNQEIRPQGWLYFMVEAQIDQLFEEYLDKGVEIVRPPQTYPWGMREFSVCDLDGYELRFGTRDAGG